ncbi:MAG: FkbM family methyltransferase [Rhodospirillales bacterium]|nr:FkbM family methyltransferase [Alphaproteobacteria bacterium]MBL6928780.1 FkbM family methyltransferase [Rhodospirillales bacterium]
MRGDDNPNSANPILACPVKLRNPFSVEQLSFLSRLHSFAHLPMRRVEKRFIGKPAKRMMRLPHGCSWGDFRSSFKVDIQGVARTIVVNARNLQFGALYQSQNRPVYEPETSALLDLLVGDGDVFFDIGANWGYYSVLIASRPGYCGHIKAFEPFPPTHQDLVGVVDQAGLADTVACYSEALSDHDDTGTMAPWDGMQSGLARLGPARDENAGRQEVSVRRLDSLDVGFPDVIKIDVEDHEAEVFAGAEATLQQAAPFIVFENWLNKDRPEVTMEPYRVLSGHGCRFFVVGWAGDGEPRFCVPELPAPEGPTLALIPLEPDSRFFFAGQLNILAVPPQRMDRLHEIFSPL